MEILIDAHRIGAGAVDAVACALCAAQPAMASVWNAAAVAVGADGLHRLRHMNQGVHRAPRVLARVLTDLLLTRGEGPRAVSAPLVVATVSASETVRVCLEALSERTRLEVICAEARPLLEGRHMAADLARARIPTTLCTDAGIGAVMAATGPTLEAVVVGADAVAPRWFSSISAGHAMSSRSPPVSASPVMWLGAGRSSSARSWRKNSDRIRAHPMKFGSIRPRT